MTNNVSVIVVGMAKDVERMREQTRRLCETTSMEPEGKAIIEAIAAGIPSVSGLVKAIALAEAARACPALALAIHRGVQAEERRLQEEMEDALASVEANREYEAGDTLDWQDVREEVEQLEQIRADLDTSMEWNIELIGKLNECQKHLSYYTRWNIEELISDYDEQIKALTTALEKARDEGFDAGYQSAAGVKSIEATEISEAQGRAWNKGYARGKQEGAAEERERCMKALCQYCREEIPVVRCRSGWAKWLHRKETSGGILTMHCRAGAIREDDECD